MITPDLPTRIIAKVPDLKEDQARDLANEAVKIARQEAPKMSGAGARGIRPVWGKGFFGIAWISNYLWFQERGTKAFTMNSLQGKTIPMWITDVDGSETQKNPKAKTRTTASGKKQILIFRKVGVKGSTKKVKQADGTTRTVPNTNYPGAPGRIALRQAKSPYTTPGKVGGQFAPGNVGVKWRHPSLAARHFLLHGVTNAARRGRVSPKEIVALTDNHKEVPIGF